MRSRGLRCGALARRDNAEQRRQRATALHHRVRGAFSHQVMGLVCEILRIHRMLPARDGQLRLSG